MPEFSYHCVNCGALLKPEDIVYDISEIAFFGATQGDYYKFPLYVSKEKLEQLFTWSEGKGTSNITLRDWIVMLYEQHVNDMDAGTRLLDGNTAYEKYLSLLQTQKENEANFFSSYDIAVIPGLPDNLSRVLVNNCMDGELCRCTIQMDAQYGYTIVEYNDRRNTATFTDQRRCKQCQSTLLERAFQCEHTLIGFIGFAKVGKTCLIAALCKYWDYAAAGCQLLLRDCDERPFRREITRHSNGFSLKKTATDGQLKVNPTIYMQDGEHTPRMITFVDIAGEAFNNEEGKFDPSMMENNFRAITDCSLYIFCTSLSAFESAEFGSMQLSLGNFVKHLMRSDEKRVASPILVAVMQMDEPTNCIEHKKDIPYIGDEYLHGREFNQIYNIRESDQLKAQMPDEMSRKVISQRLQGFMKSVSAMLYYTPITCSAYGRQPVQQELVFKDSAKTRRDFDTLIKAKHPLQIVIRDAADVKTLYDTYVAAYGQYDELVEVVNRDLSEQEREQYQQNNGMKDSSDSIDDSIFKDSPLRFSPKPRNMACIYEWVMRMIGEMEIPSRSKEQPVIPPMDCRSLSIRDYHTSELDVQVIARMFANPHKYDKELYDISQAPSFLRAVRKRNYLVRIAKAKEKGDPLLG